MTLCSNISLKLNNNIKAPAILKYNLRIHYVSTLYTFWKQTSCNLIQIIKVLKLSFHHYYSYGFSELFNKYLFEFQNFLLKFSQFYQTLWNHLEMSKNFMKLFTNSL